MAKTIKFKAKMLDLRIFFQGNSTISLKWFCLFDFASIDWICHIISFQFSI
jgi:hypothetical protein